LQEPASQATISSFQQGVDRGAIRQGRLGTALCRCCRTGGTCKAKGLRGRHTLDKGECQRSREAIPCPDRIDTFDFRWHSIGDNQPTLQDDCSMFAARNRDQSFATIGSIAVERRFRFVHDDEIGAFEQFAWYVHGRSKIHAEESFELLCRGAQRRWRDLELANQGIGLG
jgi:hypothetical protein